MLRRTALGGRVLKGALSKSIIWCHLSAEAISGDKKTPSIGPTEEKIRQKESF